MEDTPVHQRRFEAAVKVMRTLPADGVFVPSDDMLIRFYTYHRQATLGIYLLIWPILEMIPVTEEVSDLLDVLEPFYEVVEDEDKDEDDEMTSKPAILTFSGSSDEWRGSPAGDVDDDVEEDDDDAEDATKLTVANRAEIGGTRVCNVSVSSLTVSPNTDEEEEELEHTPETRQDMRRDSPAHVLQLLTDGCKLSGESATRVSDVATVLNGGKAGQGVVTDQLNTQIVVALSRLQDDMRSVLARLNTLETRALSQYQDMLNLGGDDRAQVYGAFLVYLDLTEVRRWTGVVAVPCPELQAVLLEGREKEGGEVQVVYPLPAHRSIRHRDLRCIVGRGRPTLLCAVASDSTLVYQRLSDGLVTPDPPVDIRDLGRRQHRKRRLQT
ncbi:hypothetical protein QTP86_011056 [Hemibagrus guttatus]|nr:hypothetical protein QTP86_011056 [Hemibagrus guttatus]